MDLISIIQMNIYSIMILVVVYREALKTSEKDPFQHKMFIRMVRITIFMLIIDVFARFDGNPDSIYSFINYWGNFILFLFNPILPSLWFSYVHYQIFRDKAKLIRLLYPLVTINITNVVFLILTQFFGWYYYIDSLNIYHRGPLFSLSSSFTIVIICASFFLIISNRKRIEKRFFYSLILFSSLPVVCMILQMIYYGTSLLLNGVTLSILIIFINIQKHYSYTDYLTGVNNRIKLEVYLKRKIETIDVDNTFSAIMIDLDEFKSINDNYGHQAGDEALKIAANLLESSIRSGDFLARFGGDEFWIILNTSDSKLVEEILNRILFNFENYNKNSGKPYKISFSYGYGIYDCSSNMDSEEFKMHIDDLMYKNKQANKNREGLLVGEVK